jgi:hypothetical protein
MGNLLKADITELLMMKYSQHGRLRYDDAAMTSEGEGANSACEHGGEGADYVMEDKFSFASRTVRSGDEQDKGRAWSCPVTAVSQDAVPDHWFACADTPGIESPVQEASLVASGGIAAPLEASSTAVVAGAGAQQQQDDCSNLEDRAGQEPSLLQVTDTGQVKAHPSRIWKLKTCLTLLNLFIPAGCCLTLRNRTLLSPHQYNLLLCLSPKPYV